MFCNRVYGGSCIRGSPIYGGPVFMGSHIQEHIWGSPIHGGPLFMRDPPRGAEEGEGAGERW